MDVFPSHIDKYRFGDYFSGLVDGEGHFSLLYIMENKPRCKPVRRLRAKFQLGIRSDDEPVLRLAQLYLGCGRFDRKKKRYGINHNPALSFVVTKIDDLVEKVIPHFEEHPLYAKKGRDFEIWKKGVQLIAKVSKRPQMGRDNCRGLSFKWKDVEVEWFEMLADELKEVRKFRALET